MSGEFHGEPVPIMVSPDAVGNTTKAVAKGFAIGLAAFLFSALAIRIVSRTACVVVQEKRNQFPDVKIIVGTKKPDYDPVNDTARPALNSPPK